jgi:hypothetical protein
MQNSDELAISTGKATKMIHSEACFNNKLVLVEGQEIKGYEIKAKKFSAPQYEGHKALTVTRNGVAVEEYYVSELVSK